MKMKNKNEVFNFGRFGKLLGKEIMEFFRKEWSMLIFIVAFVVVIILYFALSPSLGNFANRNLNGIYVLVGILAMIMPTQLYGVVNDRQRGVPYALLPASALEKFLSMFLVCVVIVPVILRTLVLGIEGLLALFTAVGGPDGFFNCPFTADTIELYFRDLGMMVIFQSAFFFGNLLFKKNKILFTFLWLAILHIVIFLLGMLVLELCFEEGTQLFTYLSELDSEAVPETLNVLLNIFTYAYVYGIQLILYILSFFRIKKLQYR